MKLLFHYGSKIKYGIIFHMISKSLTEGLEHPVGDAAGEGVEDGVGRVDCDPVLDARQGHALLQAVTING